MYGMYTEEGDEAVSCAISDVMEANKLKGGKLDAWDILKQIQKLVTQRGEGQVNRSKHSEYDDDGYGSEGQDDHEDDVEGFDEVTDTVVRERIMESIEPEIEEYNNQNGFVDNNKQDDDENKDYNDDEEEDDDNDEKEESKEVGGEEEDLHKRKRGDEIGDDLENSKPSKIVKKLML